AALARQDNQAARATAWLRAVQLADAQGGEARTPRTRSLGGQAALQLAAPLLAAYQQVPLTEPLQRQLKLKKARMETLLKAYADAAEVGALDVTTQATFQTGALYQDFGAALLKSQRPRKLNKAELEQYNVMLEEQAFPFEEKAIELFETNARRTIAGVYDEWVRRSLAELARLKPVRYAKAERGASATADLAAMQAALDRQPAQPALLNQLGIAHRQQGQFAAARTAYEKAIALDPAAVEPQINLGILLDVYLGDAAQAYRILRLQQQRQGTLARRCRGAGQVAGRDQDAQANARCTHGGAQRHIGETMNAHHLLMGCTLLLMGSAAVSQDRADIDRTQIIGNRELPKVLTIVPWKKPLPGTLAGRPVHSVLDEALAPVDREVFRRQVDYGTQLQARAGTPPAVAVPPATSAPPAPTR
ncbi:MAG TPA: tetratricopeptide repeat protein, partial [Rubrivivax sp.]|nr:tetratricopeptide repeat protein [Rubrivivax sp.]